MLLREETDGVLWRFTGTADNPKEEIYLNPHSVPHAPFTNTTGSFPDSAVQNIATNFFREDKLFVRGVGLAFKRYTLGGGSSGGFADSLELIEYRLASGPRVFVAAPRVSIGIENVRLDVTGRKVTNCAIPCYFAACGFGSPVDPPNTYKPCVRTRIDANASVDFWTELTILNSSGQAVYKTAQIPSAPGDLVRYVQVPLYSEPNKPLPAGAYRLMGRIGHGDVETGTSVMKIEIQ